MCDSADLGFGSIVIKEADVREKDVIEFGAFSMNGSLRPHVESLRPRKYVGVDMAEGPGVDYVANVLDIFSHFSYGTFDMVIATEFLEHVKDWRRAVSNIKHIIKPGGVVILTAPSKGCGFHACPEDHWRYEIQDLKTIFSDFIIEELWKNPLIEGVFLKARRPETLVEFDTARYKLYSIMKRRRALHNRGIEILLFKLQMIFRITRKTPSSLRHLLQGASVYEVASSINHPSIALGQPDCGFNEN